MASRRFASSITLSEGTKMNSASLSTNFLTSHGQATRSTFTCSRVIHLMKRLLWNAGTLRVARRSGRVDKNRCAMRSRQEGVAFAPLAIERQRVCAGFRRHHLRAAHRADIDDVDNARVADGDVKVSGALIEKDHVRSAAEDNIAKDPPRRGVDRDQYSRIAGTQQSALRRVEVEAVRSLRRDLVFLRYFCGVARIDRDDPRWGSDIDEEHLAHCVVDRPTGAAGNLDLGDTFAASDVNDRYRARLRDRRVADVRGDQQAAQGIEGQPVRLHAEGDLERGPLGTGCEYRDGVLAAI